MKLSFLNLLMVISFYSCKKQIFCNQTQAISRSDFAVEYTAVADETKIDNILETNPHLEVYSVLNDQYAAGVHCHLFSNGLRLLTENYSLLVGRLHPSRTELGDKRLPDVDIDINPTISSDKALEIANESQPKLKKLCNSYELAIDDKNHYTNTKEKDFRLVWIIKPQDGRSPLFRIDAASGEVVYSDDGSRQ